MQALICPKDSQLERSTSQSGLSPLLFSFQDVFVIFFCAHVCAKGIHGMFEEKTLTRIIRKIYPMLGHRMKEPSKLIKKSIGQRNVCESQEEHKCKMRNSRTRLTETDKRNQLIVDFFDEKLIKIDFWIHNQLFPFSDVEELELLELYNNAIDTLGGLDKGTTGAPGQTLRVMDMTSTCEYFCLRVPLFSWHCWLLLSHDPMW